MDSNKWIFSFFYGGNEKEKEKHKQIYMYILYGMAAIKLLKMARNKNIIEKMEKKNKERQKK